MQLIPQPWFQVPEYATVLGRDGRPVLVSEHGYPADLTATAIRCVFTDDELTARAVSVLMVTFGAELLTSNQDPM